MESAPNEPAAAAIAPSDPHPILPQMRPPMMTTEGNKVEEDVSTRREFVVRNGMPVTTPTTPMPPPQVDTATWLAQPEVPMGSNYFKHEQEECRTRHYGKSNATFEDLVVENWQLLPWRTEIRTPKK